MRRTLYRGTLLPLVMEPTLRRRRPPDCVAHVARTHWLVGGIALGSVGLLHLLTHNLPRIAFGPLTYQVTIGFSVVYLVTGTMVWFGTPFGRFCNHICSALYLVRPQLGERIWRIMRSEEFQTYFAPKR